MKTLLLFIMLGLFTFTDLVSQTDTYVITGGEMIFSFANIDDNGREESAIMRWSPVLNIQSLLNADFNNNVGILAGFSLRNIGFIYDQYRVVSSDDPNQYTEVKKKFRSYNIGIPAGIKLGNLEKIFVYGGYEIEFPFVYKEKTFSGDHKDDKFTVWFGDRQETFQHGYFVGIQLPYGLNVKFKYYMSNFHNTDYVDSDGSKPYDNLNASVFYFSLNAALLRGTKFEGGTPEKGKYY